MFFCTNVFVQGQFINTPFDTSQEIGFKAQNTTSNAFKSVNSTFMSTGSRYTSETFSPFTDYGENEPQKINAIRGISHPDDPYPDSLGDCMFPLLLFVMFYLSSKLGRLVIPRLSTFAHIHRYLRIRK